MDNIDVLVNNATSATTIAYNGDSRRKLKAMIYSANGNFFPGHTVDAGLLIDSLPTGITASFDPSGKNVSYTADVFGQIGSIQVGGTDLIDPSFNPSVQSAATYDNVLIDLLLKKLPSNFAFSFDPKGSLSITHKNTPPLVLPTHRSASITAWMRSGLGIPGTADILGSRAEGRPPAARQHPEPFRATGPRRPRRPTVSPRPGPTRSSAGQFALSTVLGGTSPFNAPQGGEDQAVSVSDRNGQAKLGRELFNFHSLSFSSGDSPKSLEVHYAADLPRKLDSRRSIRRAAASSHPRPTPSRRSLSTSSPSTWDFTTDTKKNFKSDASEAIQKIDLDATIDDSDDNAVNPDKIAVRIRGLPKNLEYPKKVEDTKDDTAKPGRTRRPIRPRQRAAAIALLRGDARPAVARGPPVVEPGSGQRDARQRGQGGRQGHRRDGRQEAEGNRQHQRHYRDQRRRRPRPPADVLPHRQLQVEQGRHHRAGTSASSPGSAGALVKRATSRRRSTRNTTPAACSTASTTSTTAASPWGDRRRKVDGPRAGPQYGELGIGGVPIKLTGRPIRTRHRRQRLLHVRRAPRRQLQDRRDPARRAPEGKNNPPGILGGTSARNDFSNVNIGTFKDKDGKDVVQTASITTSARRGCPTPASPPAAGQPTPTSRARSPGTLLGRERRRPLSGGRPGRFLRHADVQLPGAAHQDDPDITTVKLEVPNPTAAAPVLLRRCRRATT